MTALDVEFEMDVKSGSGGLHIACCLVDEFFCGAPYHPEAESSEEVAEEDCCPTCVDTLYQSMCPRGEPATHYHCPLDRVPVCPPAKRDKK